MITKNENVDDSSKVDEEITCNTIQKVDKEAECNKKKEKEEEEEKMQLFHLNIQAKKTHIDSIFDLGSQVNLISKHLANNLGLKNYNYPHPYPLGWVYKDASLQVTNQYKLIFYISKNFINEVVVDVVPLYHFGVIVVNLYLWERDVIYFRRFNRYRLMKNAKTYEVNTHRS